MLVGILVGHFHDAFEDFSFQLLLQRGVLDVSDLAGYEDPENVKLVGGLGFFDSSAFRCRFFCVNYAAFDLVVLWLVVDDDRWHLLWGGRDRLHLTHVLSQQLLLSQLDALLLRQTSFAVDVEVLELWFDFRLFVLDGNVENLLGLGSASTCCKNRRLVVVVVNLLRRVLVVVIVLFLRNGNITCFKLVFVCFSCTIPISKSGEHSHRLIIERTGRDKPP